MRLMKYSSPSCHSSRSRSVHYIVGAGAGWQGEGWGRRGRGREAGGFGAERVRLEGPKGSEESEQRPSRGASSSSTAAAAAAAAIAVVTDADYISPATDPPPPRSRLGTTGLTYILRLATLGPRKLTG